MSDTEGSSKSVLRTSRRDALLLNLPQPREVLEKITGVRTPESKGITTSLLQISKKVEDPKMQIVNLLRKAGNTKRTEARRGHGACRRRTMIRRFQNAI